MTSPTDRFDVVSHIEGALPPPLLSSASTMTGCLAAMTVWISRPATWYSTRSAPVKNGLLSLSFFASATPRPRAMGRCVAAQMPWAFQQKCPKKHRHPQLARTFPPPSLARLPIPLFSCSPHGLHRRHVIARQVAQRSTDPCRFKLQGLTLSSSYSRR